MHSKKTWVMFLVFMVSVLLVYAADGPALPGFAPEQAKKQQEQARQQQQMIMDQMKQRDPKAYAQMKTAQDLQDKVAKITTDFFAGKISYESAKSQMRPLMAQAMKDRIDNVDTEIDQLQKRIQSLKDLKNNPNKAVDKAIDVRLGKAMPDVLGVL